MLPFSSIKFIFTGIQTAAFGCGDFNICKGNFKIKPNLQGSPAKYLASSL